MSTNGTPKEQNMTITAELTEQGQELILDRPNKHLNF